MPEMDGFEVCRQLKANAATRDIPILFISALNEIEDKVEAFTLGGVDYITKPFQPQEVLARVETHLRLRELQRQLQQGIEERDELIAELRGYDGIVAHDLTEPLTTMLGYAEFMQASAEELALGETAQECVEAIRRSGCKQKEIIESLLLLARIREEAAPSQPLDMSAIVGQVLERVADDVRARSAEILQPETWPTAMGYAPWVESVWTNYLTNALKYGGGPDADPPVPPRIELGFVDDEGAYWRFWVRDNGRGIAVEDQERLFAPFTRVGPTGSIPGHGLGLAIVRRIVERLGGRVGVESVVGEGSVFSFTLPRVMGSCREVAYGHSLEPGCR
jgi:two-component system, sensor histidine kinase and response regulator